LIIYTNALLAIYNSTDCKSALAGGGIGETKYTRISGYL